MYDVKRAHSKRLTCCVQLSAIPDILKLRDEEGRSEVGEGSETEREQKKGGEKVGFASLLFQNNFFSGLLKVLQSGPGPLCNRGRGGRAWMPNCLVSLQMAKTLYFPVCVCEREKRGHRTVIVKWHASLTL